MKISLFILVWVIFFLVLLALLPFILYLIGVIGKYFKKKPLVGEKAKHYYIKDLKEPRKIIK
ncbi:hypothetical protein KY336_04670 [Candidatus Woesearchaeota archaeon]|nr:hypothetical protein [Candidatus Woesearchaeota archaeon]